MNRVPNEGKDERDLNLRSWLFVCGLALWLLLYGLIMFVMLGDKGPPDWDFNNVVDTPGLSTYSTSPEPSGNSGLPEPQHVGGRPSRAQAGRREEGK